MKKVIHVGCGQKRLAQMPAYFQDGAWAEVRFDIAPEVQPDVIGTITDMAAVEGGSMQALYSSHNIEHVYAYEVPTALREFRRVLSPDGFALITCPDMQSVAELVAQDKLTDAAYQSPSGPISPLDIIYGHGGSLARGHHYMAHRTGFTLRSLLGEMQQAGFVGLAGKRRPGPYFDLWVMGVASKRTDEELRDLAGRLFPA